QIIILTPSQCSSVAEGAPVAALRWMPIFSEKSGKRRIFQQAGCLTGGLPDVPTAGAPLSHADSADAAMLFRPGWRKGCVQRAEISVPSPGLWAVRGGKSRRPARRESGRHGPAR